MDLNVVLWILQVILALMFLLAGVMHATKRSAPPKGMEWLQAIPAPQVTLIAVLEILGAIGLVVPAATGILPILTPLAALGLALLMLGAAIFHLRRAGERGNAVMNLVVGAVLLFLAYGRFVLEPLS
ncbi:MAG: DoxX family protein [Chloroflexota bacterium]